jgi:hypothetical protein
MQFVGKPNAGRPIGAPASICPGEFADGRCDYCGGVVREIFAIELSAGFDLCNAAGGAPAPRSQRLCRGCLVWCRTVGVDLSAVTDSSLRADEGKPGDWRPQHCGPAYSIGLQPEDEEELRGLVARAGHLYSPLSQNEAASFGNTDRAVLFVGASRAGAASEVVGKISPVARERVVVVARFDGLDDIEAAIGLGAGAFLASPLSHQQIDGVFAQVGSRLGLLPRLAQAKDYVVDVPAGFTPGEVAWLLRRFLRGHDRVALDGDGHVRMQLAGGAGAARAALERLHRLIGSDVALPAA